MRRLRDLLVVVLFLGCVAVYVLASFNPQQPTHHEFEQAGGVLVVSGILLLVSYWFTDG